ncbi:MAG: hypothetical protein R2880_10780 [Deinococcales bacterium]
MKRLSCLILLGFVFLSARAQPSAYSIPPQQEYDTEFYLAEGVPLQTILELAWSKRVRGYHDGALFYYQLAAQRYSQSYEAHNALAAYLYERGHLEAAKQSYQHALNVAISASDQASARYFGEQIDKELRWGKAAVNAYDSGYANFAVGNYSLAINQLSEALRTAPSWINAHYWLGRSYESSGDRASAIQEYNYVMNNDNPDSDLYKGARWQLMQMR